ncbi:hypothetical protein [Galactobacter sp.]|uniref:hypothetical protein n=1 Tax=Galactobacter sp. TaxID=2676125 RepID=UPI0025B81B48|nr:hypothetical protein [Galactobacter sp.]
MPGYVYKGAKKNPPTIVLPTDRRKNKHGKLLSRCGTTAGYARHRYHNEEQCDACKIAHAAADNKRGRKHTGKVLGPVQCGTRRGWENHSRRGEMCYPCKAAYNEYRAKKQREYDARKRAERAAQ